MNCRSALCIGLVFMGCAWAAPMPGKTEVSEKLLTFKQGGTVKVLNYNGRIQVQSWDRDEVKLITTKRIKGISDFSAAEKLAKWESRVEKGPDLIEVTTIRPEEKRLHRGVSVQYELWVPKGTELDLKTSNGKIQVEGDAAAVRAASSNGSIHIGEARGAVKASTSNGSIAIDAARGNIRAETSNGSIRAKLVEHDGQDLFLRTSNGSIKLWAAGDLSADVEAHCSNGSVTTDFPVSVSGRMAKNHLKGEINGGGAQMVLKTSNGSIHILEH